MSTQRDVSAFQDAWETEAAAATPWRLIELTESLTSFRGQPAASATLSLSGSLQGIQLDGAPQAVKEDFTALENKVFVAGTLVASYPVEGTSTLSLTVNFALRQVTVSIQPGNPSVAREMSALIRDRFPHVSGPSATEIESKAAWLDHARVDVEGLVQTLRALEATRGAAEASSASLSERLSVAEGVLEQIRTAQTQAGVATTETQATRDQAAQILAEVRNLQNEATTGTKAVQTSASNASALEAKLVLFHGEIEQNEQKLAKLQVNSTASVEEFRGRTTSIVSENERLQTEIREQLLKAAGGALFRSFEERKNAIVTAKWRWAIASSVSLLLQAAAAVWLSWEAKTVPTGEGPFYTQPMFILKAVVTVPILGLIVFCIRQYANEREAEEVYAFKSALSFSLSPYLDLVGDLEKKGAPKEHLEFVIRTMGQVFESPQFRPQREGRRSRKDGMLLKEALDKIVELVGKLRP